MQISGNRARDICELEARDAQAAIKRVGCLCAIDDRHRQLAYRVI
jgi:hypothetical protein